jgi:hypothetical protein
VNREIWLSGIGWVREVQIKNPPGCLLIFEEHTIKSDQTWIARSWSNADLSICQADLTRFQQIKLQKRCQDSGLQDDAIFHVSTLRSFGGSAYT